MISTLLLRGFVSKEFRQSLRDPRMQIVLFIAPIVQVILFGVALSTDVKNIKLWAMPNKNDSILQHIYEHSIESKWFLPASYNHGQDPFDLLRAEKIDAALIPPPGGLTHALGHLPADLQLLIDATNVIKAQSVETYIKNIVPQVVLNDLEIPPVEMPITFSVRVLFNPNLETTFFMVPGVMCLVMTVVTVVLTSISITREKEMGTFEMLISAPVTADEVILGKTIPFMIIGMVNVPLILLIAVLVFDVPMRGSFLVLTLASFAFVCSAVSIGTLISTFAKNQQQSILGGFLFLFPAIMFSGMFFPLENMPEILKWVSYFDPLAHFLSLLRNIMLKGGEIRFIAFHVTVLFLMALVFVYISFKRFHTTLQ